MKQQRQQQKVTGYVTTTTSYWSWNRSKCRHSVDSSRVFNHNNSNNKTTATVRHRPQMCFSQQIVAVGYNNNIAELQRRIQAMEIRCYRKTLCISYKDRVNNKEVHAKIKQGRPPDHCKEMQTAVVWSCLPFIKSGQNHLARHSERRKKTRQAEKEVGKTTSGNGQAWSLLSHRRQ